MLRFHFFSLFVNAANWFDKIVTAIIVIDLCFGELVEKGRMGKYLPRVVCGHPHGMVESAFAIT